jgi:hypothetical protein
VCLETVRQSEVPSEPLSSSLSARSTSCHTRDDPTILAKNPNMNQDQTDPRLANQGQANQGQDDDYDYSNLEDYEYDDEMRHDGDEQGDSYAHAAHGQAMREYDQRLNNREDTILPPGFSRNPYTFSGMKFDLGKIPILGEGINWDDWKLKVDGVILCQPWAWELFSDKCSFLLWQMVKMWLGRWLSRHDGMKVTKAPTWIADMQALKDAHSPDDATTVDKVTGKPWYIKLGEKNMMLP